MNKKQRPVIADLIQPGTNEIESFQNKTIRPIIKMQHDLIIASFKIYLEKRKVNFSNFTEEQKLKKIENIFSKDTNYKHTSLGYIIGHFSVDEYQFYSKNSSEINKRILKITHKRIQDSLLDFFLT